MTAGSHSPATYERRRGTAIGNTARFGLSPPPAAVVCHCMFPGASAPPHSSTWSSNENWDDRECP